MINAPSNRNVIVMLLIFLSCVTTIAYGMFAMTEVIDYLLLLIAGTIWFRFGLFREAKNRALINAAPAHIKKSLRPLNRAEVLTHNATARALRTWYFGVCWPFYLMAILNSAYEASKNKR